MRNEPPACTTRELARSEAVPNVSNRHIRQIVQCSFPVFVRDVGYLGRGTTRIHTAQASI